VARQRGHHEDLQRKADEGRVDVRADDSDDARLLERPHPVQGRGRGQPGDTGEFDVGLVGVGLQLGEELNVNFIKFDGHETKLYLARGLNCQIITSSTARWRT
jgi:hypothetical protein